MPSLLLEKGVQPIGMQETFRIEKLFKLNSLGFLPGIHGIINVFYFYFLADCNVPLPPTDCNKKSKVTFTPYLIRF
jgi:hypothetical protein